MSFVINQTTVNDATLTANVSFTLEDGTVLDPIDIPIFCPQTTDDILNGIANREITEQRKYDALNPNTALKDQLDNEIVGASCAMDAESGKVVIGKIGGDIKPLPIGKIG
jgi:hypothetical protein